MDIRVAAYAVITDDAGRVLLAHWNEHGRSGWTMPGGGLEPGEDPADAVVREVEEETGYDVEVVGLAGIDSRIVPAEHRITGIGVALHTLRIVYRARVTGGALRNEVGGSTDEAAWFDRAAIAELDRVSLVDAALAFVGAAV